MQKSKFIFLIIVLLVVENIVTWFAGIFYYQNLTHNTRIESKKG